MAGTAAAMAVGMAVRASALLTRSLWLGQWPRPVADVGIGWRRRRWRRRVAKRVALQEKYPPETRDEAQQDAVDRAAAALTRLSPARPGRPTWQGDQAIAPMTVARERSGLDLEYAWPRLWLVLPDSTRTTLTAAETSYAAAVLGASWAWPYLALGFWWQPAFLVAAAVWTVGLVRARAAIRAVAVLVESVIDVHARSLAVALGTASTAGTGPLTVEEGAATTAAVRKGR